MKMSNAFSLDNWLESRLSGITLISSDGSRILSFGCHPETWVAYRDPNWQQLPKIPAGTYYAVPGRFLAHRAQVRLVERALAGENLDLSGVPKIVVVKDQEATLDFDAVVAENAIMGVLPAAE
ncbi:MAG: hypothetical protein NTV94_16750 [Planctomycetota bacterium]|nr:hypothetical protein [Planctomycetota bacterium]